MQISHWLLCCNIFRTSRKSTSFHDTRIRNKWNEFKMRRSKSIKLLAKHCSERLNYVWMNLWYFFITVSVTHLLISSQKWLLSRFSMHPKKIPPGVATKNFDDIWGWTTHICGLALAYRHSILPFFSIFFSFLRSCFYYKLTISVNPNYAVKRPDSERLLSIAS